MLRRLGFLLTHDAQDGDQADVHDGAAALTDPELELPDGLDERHRLDVANLNERESA